MIRHLSFRLRIAGAIAMLTLGFLLFGAVAFQTLNRLQVSGPVYTDIVRGKDLIADILPPPAYIIDVVPRGPPAGGEVRGRGAAGARRPLR